MFFFEAVIKIETTAPGQAILEIFQEDLKGPD